METTDRGSESSDAMKYQFCGACGMVASSAVGPFCARAARSSMHKGMAGLSLSFSSSWASLKPCSAGLSAMNCLKLCKVSGPAFSSSASVKTRSYKESAASPRMTARSRWMVFMRMTAMVVSQGKKTEMFISETRLQKLTWAGFLHL